MGPYAGNDVRPRLFWGILSHMRLPAFFISHGGGPWPFVEEMRAEFARTEAWLRALPATLPRKPKAIVSISGHWEEEHFTVSSASRPPMIYDYYGFPPHTYHVQYQAPGSPEVAARVRELLTSAGIQCNEDRERGFDHGTFVPLALIYPRAEVPVVSLSLRANLDAAEHLRMGAALAPLRNEDVLIMGSGLSYHNLRAMRTTPGAGPVSERFEAWLTEAVQQDAEARTQQLQQWHLAPGARAAHPREDHLIPLMAAAGAADGDAGSRVFLDHVWGIAMSSYQFGV
jgi:aromatic ring-opening dioxygenase catalytic subunit (LigB family)